MSYLAYLYALRGRILASIQAADSPQQQELCALDLAEVDAILADVECCDCGSFEVEHLAGVFVGRCRQCGRIYFAIDPEKGPTWVEPRSRPLSSLRLPAGPVSDAVAYLYGEPREGPSQPKF